MPAGSTCLIAAITPPAWCCLYLKLQQEILMRTSFRNRVVFLWGNYIISENSSRKRENFSLWTQSSLHNVLWENLPGLHLMLHEHKMHCNWMNIGFTEHLHSSSYSILLNSNIIKLLCCQCFPTETQRTLYQISLSVLISSPHPCTELPRHIWIKAPKPHGPFYLKRFWML